MATKGSVLGVRGTNDEEFGPSVFLVLGFGARNAIAAFVAKLAFSDSNRKDLALWYTEVQEVLGCGIGALFGQALVVGV